MERLEDLRLGGLKIWRRDDLPGYTTDSVLLADFAAKAYLTERVQGFPVV